MRTWTVGIASNAFKGSLSAIEATQAIAEGIARSRLKPSLRLMPLADGGDGTLETMLTQAGSTRQTLTVDNALGEPVQADYGLLADGETAVIEMALAVGLGMLGERRDALGASSYGMGQLMRHAIESGRKRLIVGLGGSACSDGGAGCLQALGVGLFDTAGQPIPRGGAGLRRVARIEPSRLLKGVELLVLCDVDNPPLGEKGAAAVFSPQKGASPEQVAELEANLSHFFGVIADQLGVDVRTLPGGGAAGATAGGLAALGGAKLVSGAETLIHFLGYDAQIRACDLIITGEGRLDTQTEHGKAPAVIAAHAAQHGIPTIAIAGSIPTDPDALAKANLQAAFSLLPRPAALEDAMQHAGEWLALTAQHIGNLIAAVDENY